MQETFSSQQNTLNVKEHPDLYHRSIKGGYWAVFLHLATNLLSFIKVIVIARIFGLEDLGIISVALMVMDTMSMFTETGFNSALIQKKSNIQNYLNTAWTAGLFKGIVLFLALFFAAPFLASIRVSEDKIPLAISILRAMSVCFLFNGLRNIGTIYFQKDLDFKKVFTLKVIFSLTDIVLAVTFVFIFRSIWGITAARLIAIIASCITTYILSSYRPRVHFEFAKARELWQFGKWIYGINILGYIISQGDNYFVWSFLDIQRLALYKYAFDFATLPAKHITGVISSVSFPAYSKIQNDIPRLCEAYLKVLKVTALLFVPASFLIFSLGPDFVKLFLPERMTPMIFTLQLLAFKGFMVSFNATTAPVYQSVGKPKISWKLAACFLPIQAILIYPLTKMWGITGTALSTIIPGLCITPVSIMILCRILNCSVYKIFRVFLIPVITSAAMTGLLFLLKTWIFMYLNYISFGALCIIGVCFYSLGLWILDGLFRQGIRELIVEQFQFLKRRLGYTCYPD